MQGGGILPPEGKQGLDPTASSPLPGLMHPCTHPPGQHRTLALLSPWGSQRAGRAQASPLLPGHYMALGAGETGHCPPSQSHPVCHQDGDASPLPAPGWAVPPPGRDTSPQSGRSEGAITLWGMLAMGGAGWGPTGRAERGELRDVGSEVGAGQCPLPPEHHARMEHTRAEPRHLPDRGRLAKPAKGKIERVGRGEGKRGQKRGARRSWSRATCAQRMPWSP